MANDEDKYMDKLYEAEQVTLMVTVHITKADLSRLCELGKARGFVRMNGNSLPYSEDEIKWAARHGADIAVQDWCKLKGRADKLGLDKILALEQIEEDNVACGLCGCNPCRCWDHSHAIPSS